MAIKIVLDSGSDIPEEWIKNNKMRFVPLTVIDVNENKEYQDYYEIHRDELYKKMREGTVYKTSQPSPELFYKVMKEELEAGNEVLCLTLSSGISGTYQSAKIAQQKLNEEGLGDSLYVLDTLAACGGYSMVAITTQKYIDAGASFEDVKKYAEKLASSVRHLFSVDDLVYLYRGGRVSKASKIVSGVLDIKPILKVNPENGKLESYDKARGESKVNKTLVKSMLEDSSKENILNQQLFIFHSDCPEKAEKLKTYIEKELGVNNFLVSEIGCTIGAHTGPGTISLYYFKDPIQ